VAGHVRFELRNVAANYPFERSHRFAGAAGGVYLVRSANVERIEGAAPKRLLITKWDNLDKLTSWRESDAHMNTLPLLDKAVRSVRSYAVEGVN
jgi:uncharacterized protein (DUF1330 family)